MLNPKHDSCTKTIIEAILAADKEIKAWTYLDIDLRDDSHCPSPDRGGLLDGIPIGVKDIFDTAAMPTSYGSDIFANFQPVADAVAVQRIKAAGALLVGKTQTTEFAYLHPTVTRNPHDLSRTPGGSSSGSAAAVAAGMVPLAIGTQTAGSTIRPASYCGIWGFKPTYGLIPMTGARPLAPSLDTIGLFAKSLRLLINLFEVLSAGEAGVKNFEKSARMKIGVIGPGHWDNCEDSVHRLFKKIKDALANSDVILTEIGVDMAEITRLHRIQISIEASIQYENVKRKSASMLSSEFQELLEEGERYRNKHIDINTEIELARKKIDIELSNVDFILMPSSLDEAPKLAFGTGNPDPCRMASLFGLPAINIPAPGDGGVSLPIGYQLIGRKNEDLNLLNAAGRVAKIVKSNMSG